MYSAAKATYGIDMTRNGKNERRQDEINSRNRLDVGHSTGCDFGGIPAKPLDGTSHRTVGWNKRRMVYRHCCRCYGNGLDI